MTTYSAQQRRPLSPIRVLIAVVVLLGIVAGVGYVVRRQLDHPASIAASAIDAVHSTWFAPYVDVTASPTYSFQDPAYNPAQQVVLGFVVASHSSACTPSWGGAYTLGEAESALDLDQRVVQYREREGQVVVSFGGQDNDELAVTCARESDLEAAYLQVIKRYDVTTVDFDIEGTDLADTVAAARRAAAVAAVQKRLSASGEHLQVWLTLPSEPAGLAPDALAQVDAMLSAHVSLAGVNILAMDFGTAAAPTPKMLDAVEDAIDAAHRQTEAVYLHYGLALTAREVWNRLGVTVMIGQNDVGGEQFTTHDASQLAAYAGAVHLGRVSIWSLNRDTPCGTYYAEIGVLSDDCSGVSQSDLGFTTVFDSLKGTLPSGLGGGAAVTPPALPKGGGRPTSDPYPVWNVQEAYVAGYKVVWQGEIFQAKWYNQGADPAAVVQHASQTPWLLIGPVLPGDHAPTTTTLPPGTYPAWSPTGVYRAGARVLMNGEPYEAKWYTVGTQPGSDPADPSASPWRALFRIPGEPAQAS